MLKAAVDDGAEELSLEQEVAEAGGVDRYVGPLLRLAALRFVLI